MGRTLRPTGQESNDFGLADPNNSKSKKLTTFFSPNSGEVEAIKVHYLGPRRHEVFHKLLLGVRARIDFSESTQRRLRTQDQVYAGSGPLELVRLPVVSFVQAFGNAFDGSGGLPLRMHVEQIAEEIVCQRLGPLGEDAVGRLPVIGPQHTQATNENRHLGSSHLQQLRPIYQHLLSREALLAAAIVAEAIGFRFERREGLDVCLFLRRVHAPRCEWDLNGMPGSLRGFLDRRIATENDQVSQRDPLALTAVRLGAVELFLDAFELRQHLRQFSRLVDFPVLLRREANACAIRSAALVRAAERRRRSPRRRYQLRNR